MANYSKMTLEELVSLSNEIVEWMFDHPGNVKYQEASNQLYLIYNQKMVLKNSPDCVIVQS